MDQIVIYIAILVFIYLIRIGYKKFYRPKIKGAIGEHSIARRLKRLNRKKYKVYNDIYLKVDDKTTQIDHLVTSKYGVFVIETKNYNGWIHGNEKSEYWTQTIYRNKTKFRNPIKQNWAHIYFLKNVLSNFETLTFHPIIVFTGNARLKNIYSSIPVIYSNKLIREIKQNKTPILTQDQLEQISNQINTFIIDKKEARKEHKKYVRRNIREREQNIKSLICPNCGGALVVRKGQYGSFYGCSNYPKCKFSKKL